MRGRRFNLSTQRPLSRRTRPRADKTPTWAGRSSRGLLRVAVLALVSLAAECYSGRPTGPVASAPAPSTAVRYDPSRDLGRLFPDVQLSGIFSDSKTFVDARALAAPAEIAASYAEARTAPGFDLAQFVAMHFEPPRPLPAVAATASTLTMEEHIRALWPALIRAADIADPRSTLLPLQRPYVVPGGRFREVYYWDSYFTMLGLIESGRIDLVKSILDNFADLAREFGHVPNGNRTYYLSRSQPPYLAAMVALYAAATEPSRAVVYLDALEREHAFWMEGAAALAPGEAHRRVVRLTNGATLNRYWDERADPRPESYRADVEIGGALPEPQRARFYRNVRAAAESGWDFSSRWMRDPADLRTLETTDLVPVDLNSLLYDAELTIATLHRARGQADEAIANDFLAMADARREALLTATYDPITGFFYDVRLPRGERVTDRPTLAAASVLFFGLATPEQGRRVAERLHDFLMPGGFVTTTIKSGQQWDAPNGWAPLQWIAIQGANRYGANGLSREARTRWLAQNRRTYRATGKMMEKYDVSDLQRTAGGGEYPTQDGFGWSNGVALALSAEEQRQPLGQARP